MSRILFLTPVSDDGWTIGEEEEEEEGEGADILSIEAPHVFSRLVSEEEACDQPGMSFAQQHVKNKNL